MVPVQPLYRSACERIRPRLDRVLKPECADARKRAHALSAVPGAVPNVGQGGHSGACGDKHADDAPGAGSSDNEKAGKHVDSKAREARGKTNGSQRKAKTYRERW